MCARAELSDAPKLAAARLPIWNFCGDRDEQETVEFSRQMHQELTQAAAADVLGISEATLKRRWLAARRRLHQLLKGELPGN